MDNTAVLLENISKKFKVFYESPALIKNILPFLKTPGSYDTLWSLNNISMRLEKGKCYALIGRNGSGKSTLLQTIAGILTPNSGKLTVSGKISTLLELCSGFHPELTGKENIYLNSSIMGMSKKEIVKKMDKILEFSELEKFIDSKIKIYSAGMFMRLGFSIAIQLNFDIFLCDEAIAVGDMKFQHKCFDKIIDFKRMGKCIVFASHDLNAISKIADYVFWLEKGIIKAEGPANVITEKYFNENI
ncbi:MAG TPA: ABC transporter ATP-binding protein [bacterium]|nr:ABC transporter ATP-binding protein [bacterium]HPN30948.1 ABC transporter ATP-binding protein [bacterium]